MDLMKLNYKYYDKGKFMLTTNQKFSYYYKLYWDNGNFIDDCCYKLLL